MHRQRPKWQAIAGSLLDDGDTTTAVATAAGGWAGGLAGRVWGDGAMEPRSMVI